LCISLVYLVHTLTCEAALSRKLGVPNLQELLNELKAITEMIPEYWGLDGYPDDDDEYYLDRVDVWSNQVCYLLNELADTGDVAPFLPKKHN
jgi:hypothetical protein